MADLTVQDINQQLGTEVFSVSGGRLRLDLDALSGRSFTLASELAQPIFDLLQALSVTAVETGTATRTYFPIDRRVRGSKTYLTATLAVRASLSDKARALNTKPLTLNGVPLTLDGNLLFL